jgi:hypothetical protein
MPREEIERFLVAWMNANAAGVARNISVATHSDTSLVLMAFDLRKLARDLAEHVT